MSKINILCIYSDLSGVGYYRTIWVSKNLEKLYPGEFKVEIQGSNSVNWNDDNYLKQFAIIHYHRTMVNYEQMELLMKKLRGFGIKLIMDLDDYWSVSPQHPSYHMVKRDKLNEKILGNVKTADWMTVTTPIFADEIKKFNKNVFVLPNTIDPTIEQFIPQNIEREKVAVGWLGGCYDDKTEILTENGWKLFKDLKEGKEKVATLNSKNGKLEYQLPIEYFKYQYKGKLNCAKTQNISYAVTPNHNMYLCPALGTWKLKQSSDSYKTEFYLKDKDNNYFFVEKENQYQSDYDGYVYCVEVPNHLLYVRRKDSTNCEKGFWCGNSSHMSDLEILKGMFQRLRVDPIIDKTQIVLCGYDLRGSHTDINQQTGEQKTRDIQPKETSWYQFERIFTDDYKIIKDKKYLDFLMKFKREDYPGEEKQVYRRVWTKLLSKYATNYNLFDIALAPLSPNIFNLVKSQLKIIESGFHKKMLIAQDYGPYTIDGIHGKNCLLVEERKNHKNWFKFVKQGVESKAMREDLGEALYETVKVKYHIDTDSKNRREFYLSIL